MIDIFPDKAIRHFLSNVSEASGGLVHWNILSLSCTGLFPVATLTGIAGAVASEASQVAYR
jgi:hypothetical protein